MATIGHKFRAGKSHSIKGPTSPRIVMNIPGLSALHVPPLQAGSTHGYSGESNRWFFKLTVCDNNIRTMSKLKLLFPSLLDDTVIFSNI